MWKGSINSRQRATLSNYITGIGDVEDFAMGKMEGAPHLVSEHPHRKYHTMGEEWTQSERYFYYCCGQVSSFHFLICELGIMVAT